jgi:AbrB family looped-hinge helix DNA binding protein
MPTTTVSSKFQVVLPKAVREHYNLHPGQVLQLICLPDRIELLPLQPASALRGFLKGPNSFEREPDRL